MYSAAIVTTQDIYIPCINLSVGPIVAGFSTRRGGDDPSLMAQAAGFDADRLFTLTQVHSARVVRIGRGDSPARLAEVEADAMVTSEPGVFMAVKTADCVPVILAHTERRVVAAVHAGWRGLVSDVIAAAVATVAELAGAPPSEIKASVGPAIAPCCFEVGREVADELARALGTREIILERKSRPHADLWSAAKLRLEQSGLRPDRIEFAGSCTKCGETIFHSYRREGPGAGRQLSFVGIREEGPELIPDP